jgi:hypothetical protein
MGLRSISQALTLFSNTIRHPIIRDHVMTFADFARAMTCTVVAFASLKASDNQVLLRLDHPNGDTLCVHGTVASKGPVLTTGEDFAVFTFDQDEGSSAYASPNSGATCNFEPETRWTKPNIEGIQKGETIPANSPLVLSPNGSAFLLIDTLP